MSWRRHLRLVAASTEPTERATDRLRERLDYPRSLLRATAREPAAGATARLARNLRGRRRVRGRRGLWVGALVTAGVIVLTWAMFPGPPETLDETLSAETEILETLTKEVVAEYTGSGHVRGTTRAPRLRWEVGTLALEVEPNRGIDLVVETEEALVSVVGTVFSVTRDALGTTVDVTRGAVTVRCVGKPAVSLGPGDRALCLPARGAGMLNRAQHLLDRGALPEEVLDSVERGLRLVGDDDPATGELLALRIQVLLSLGRDREALADARRYLAIGGPRSEEVRAVVQALAPNP